MRHRTEGLVKVKKHGAHIPLCLILHCLTEDTDIILIHSSYTNVTQFCGEVSYTVNGNVISLKTYQLIQSAYL